MTHPSRKEQGAFERLIDALVEDILEASDEEILAEATEDGTDLTALVTDMKRTLDGAVTKSAKEALVAAKAATVEYRKRESSIAHLSPVEARHRLEKELAADSDIRQSYMLAARKSKGGSLTDDEVRNILEDIEELRTLSIQPDGDKEI